MSKLYAVTVPSSPRFPSGYLRQQYNTNGAGVITAYTRGEAIKKANMFGGKIQELGKLCITDGFITMYQKKADCFTVVYGMQINTDLTYAEAATQYGECIMHALACDGKLDNGCEG